MRKAVWPRRGALRTQMRLLALKGLSHKFLDSGGRAVRRSASPLPPALFAEGELQGSLLLTSESKRTAYPAKDLLAGGSRSVCFDRDPVRLDR